MTLKRRAVVVGIGSIGRRHARLLNDRVDVDVELCEPEEVMIDLAYQEVGRLPVHVSFEEALACEPDFVVIATPHQLHCEQTVQALDRGIHVLCEKPMSDRLEDAATMMEAATRSEAILSIGFMLHFHPGILRLKELISNGTLGTVLQVQYKVGSYVTLVNSLSRFQAAMEGSLLLDFAHQPDIIHWILGQKPKGVHMAARQGGEMELTSQPNFLTMVYDYEEPLLATVELNYLQMPERHECEIIGDRGWALYDLNQGELRIGSKEDGSLTKEKILAERDDVFRKEHQAFLDAIDGKRKPSSPPEEALVSMEIIHAAIASWKSGKRIELSDGFRQPPVAARHQPHFHGRPVRSGTQQIDVRESL